MFAPQGNTSVIKIPLQIVLIALFVTQVVLVAGAIGFLSFRNSQQAVDNLAYQFRSQIDAYINEHLGAFMDTPHHINQLNATAIRQKLLDAGDQNILERRFWDQIHIFDSVNGIFFGNPAGGLVGAVREEATGSLYVIDTAGFAAGPLSRYVVDSQGNRTGLLQSRSDYDARTRPWYTRAIEQGDETWSQIYLQFTSQELAITASRPVYDEHQNLLGVVSVSIFLSQLSGFLQTLDVGENGQSFIIERSGLLVASSADEKPFIESNGEATPRRLYANESTNPLIRTAADALTQRFGHYDLITAEQKLNFELGNERQFLHVSPVRNEYNLDWLIVTVIPESNFMGQINANNQFTLRLMGVALIVAVVVGIITARWMTRPILHLNTSAQTVAKGEWQEPLLDDSWITEIAGLTLSFNKMTKQLQQMLTSLTTEIAERKQVEEQLLQTMQEKDAAFSLLNTLFATAPVGLAFVDPSLSYVQVNQKLAEINGLPAEAHIGRRLDEILPELGPALIPSYLKVLETQAPVVDVDIRGQVPSAPGVIRDWIANYYPVTGRNGEILGVGIVVLEVTERKQAEEALRQSHHHLEQALTDLKEAQETMMQQERLAAVGQLAAGIAHDFNNILTSILGYAELLCTSPDMPAAVQADLTRIITSGRRAAHLVRQILDFSRKSIRQPKRLDLVPFLKEDIKFLEHTIPENIHISLEIGSGAYLIEADPTQVQQMLANLAVNARDAMPGGGELKVILSQVKSQGEQSCVVCNQAIKGEWLCLTVSDTGSGIPSHVLPHIFEPFFTTKEVGQGSGLGLAQVLGIVQQHRGHIVVDSRAGQGTTFAIYLPALTPAYNNNSEPDQATPIRSGQGETILLVEDELIVLEANKVMLQSLGYRVLTAANGQEALDVYTAHQDTIALVLSDMVMPKMEGVALLNLLKALNHDVRIVLMTGYPLDENELVLLEQQVVGWFRKPVSMSDLSQIVSRALSVDKNRSYVVHLPGS